MSNGITNKKEFKYIQKLKNEQDNISRINNDDNLSNNSKINTRHSNRIPLIGKIIIVILSLLLTIFFSIYSLLLLPKYSNEFSQLISDVFI